MTPHPAHGEHWLLHIDRRALNGWTSLHARDATVAAECGENMRVVSWGRCVEAAMFATSPFVRYAQPVSWRSDIKAARADLAKITSELVALARSAGAARAASFAIRKHGARVAQALRDAMARELGEATLASHQAPILMVAVGDREILAGGISRLASRSPYPGGWLDVRQDASPSRARWKLVEALAWLDVVDPRPMPRRWLELGAFPGGMTTELAARGAFVTAVDLAAADATLKALPGVEWHHADTGSFVPRGEFDAILCDVNGPPTSAARNVARLAAWLAPEGIVVHTLKLPHWEDYPSVRGRIDAIFASAALSVIDCRHLAQNHQEVTIFARKARV